MMDMADPSQLHDVLPKGEAFGASDQVGMPSDVYEYDFYALTEQVDLSEGHSDFGWVPICEETLKSTQGEIKLVPEKHFSCAPCEYMMGIGWDGSTLFIVGAVSERSLYRVDIVEEDGVDGRILPKKYTFDGFPGMARFNDVVAVVNKGTYFFVPGYGKEWGRIYDIKNDKWSDVVGPYEGLKVVRVHGCFDWNGKVVVLVTTISGKAGPNLIDGFGFYSLDLSNNNDHQDKNWVHLGDFGEDMICEEYPRDYGFVQVENIIFAVGVTTWTAFDLQKRKRLETFAVDFQDLPKRNIMESEEDGNEWYPPPDNLICLSKTWQGGNSALIGLNWFFRWDEDDIPINRNYFVKVQVEKKQGGETFTGGVVSAAYFNTGAYFTGGVVSARCVVSLCLDTDLSRRKVLPQVRPRKENSDEGEDKKKMKKIY